jgi:hypothetical protein
VLGFCYTVHQFVKECTSFFDIQIAPIFVIPTAPVFVIESEPIFVIQRTRYFVIQNAPIFVIQSVPVFYTGVTIFKKGDRALVVIYQTTSILNNFSSIFKSIIYDQLSFYIKSRLHLNQQGFVKSKSAVTNLVTCFKDVLSSVCSQGQFDSVHFKLSQAFHKSPHIFLLDKLSNTGLPSFYIKQFHTYSSNKPSFVSQKRFLLPLPYCPEYNRIPPLYIFCLTFLLMTICQN